MNLEENEFTVEAGTNMHKMNRIKWDQGLTSFLYLCLVILIACTAFPSIGKAQDTESAYYRIADVPIPDDIALEVGGLETMPDGRLAVSTRRGEVWIIDHASQNDGQEPTYSLFAEGLHEPLGIAYKDDGFYVIQRPELTRLEDTDGDGKADLYKTVFTRKLSGNYHEYAYGPIFLPNGDMLVNFNLAWMGASMKSPSKWDGWMVKISPDGTMEPMVAGMRSPAGLGINKNGDIFYTENQGGWVGSGKLTHLEKGDFVGHPAGLRWSDQPKSPVELNPEDIPDTGKPLHEVAKDIPGLKTPSVWFPHGILGISTSDILLDTPEVDFGPYDGQLFIGDQGQSKIMRVYQEKVNGEYQGVAFPFRSGFESGVIRMDWGQDNTMFVGMTSRGWGSTGGEPYGLQQVIWNGETPFEIKEVHAKADGFELVFTKPVDQASASDPASYEITTFTYHYHSSYGSDIINQESAPVTDVEVSDDGFSAQLTVSNLRQGYIHEIKAEGVRDQDGEKSLVHPVGYYTLKNIPAGGQQMAQDQSSAGNGNESVYTEAEQAKHQTTQPDSWTGGADKVIKINAVTGMKYDVTDFEVKAGSKVKLTFNNPTDLLHNLLIVQRGSLESVAKEAMDMGLNGPKRGYVPNSEEVLFFTSLLEVGKSQSIYFTAPEQPGDYPYVCTFPGHWQTMQGTMTVTE